MIRALAGPLVALSFVLSAYGAAPNSNRFSPTVRAVQKVRPAVVNIHSEKNVPGGAYGAASNRMSGMGTGVIVDHRGYIVTNYHVIEDVSSIRVTLADNSQYPAEVVARDPETDLALLKIEPRAQLQIMPMGTSDDLMQGESVLAVGNAYGYEHTVTEGIVSELHRDVRLSDHQAYRDLIQTDASINPGNSGGPLVNADGEMIGLNVAIRAGAQGIGFAIPVNDVKRVVSKLMSVDRISSVWHGMVCVDDPLAEENSGRVIVQAVQSNSPAARAGIRSGDRLVRLGTMPLSYSFDVERSMIERHPAETVPVQLVRDGRNKKLSMTVEASPRNGEHTTEDVIWQKLGLRLADGPAVSEVRQISAQLRGGLRIVDVAGSSPAARAGFRPGDVLVGLHHWETLSVENVVYVLTQRNTNNLSEPIRFFVIRNGQIQRGMVDLPST